MKRYRLNLPEGVRFVEAAKAIRKNEQLLFFEADGRGIVAQYPATLSFCLDTEESR